MTTGPRHRPALPVRPATRRDVAGVAASLARAFEDDPVWVWLSPDPRRRSAHFARFFAHVVANRVGQGTAWTTPAASGAALWGAPGRWQVPWTTAAAWLPASLRAFGVAPGMVRSLRAAAVMERDHPREPHWYLECLGCDPDLQGRGVGAALLVPVLERCDHEGLPAFLESSKPENVPWYERHGFAVTEEFHVAAGSPPVWRMWRTPR